jgi:dienelactone hydrolase
VNGIKLDLKSFVKNVSREMNKREKKAISGAANLLYNKIKDATPVGETGNLKKSLAKKQWPHSIGIAFNHPQGAHFHLIEYGHDIIRNGVKVGHVEGTHFAQKAREAARPEVERLIKDAFADL